MKREQVERELREKLTAHRSMPGALDVPLAPITVMRLASTLLPWIMELIEHSQAMARMEMGELP